MESENFQTVPDSAPVRPLAPSDAIAQAWREKPIIDERSSYPALTPKQILFLRALAKCGNVGQAAKETGCSRQNGYRTLTRARGRVPEIMDELGLSEFALVENYLKPLLNAEKTEFAKFEGKITDALNVNDNGTRLSALDIAAKMRGMYSDSSDRKPEGIAIQIQCIGITAVTLPEK